MAFKINDIDITTDFITKTEIGPAYAISVIGSNNHGQLGINSNATSTSTVIDIPSAIEWVQVVSASDRAATIKRDGTLWLWGKNTEGQIGDNTIIDQSSPVQEITGSTNWAQIACGSYHSSAIKTDGTLWTWGDNSLGELGDNTIVGKSSPVQEISVGADWAQVSCGEYFTLAIKTNGTLWACGGNSLGELGDNTIIDKSAFVQEILGGTDWAQVSCGYHHSVALKTDGSLWTCGNNSKGQLGDNTQIAQSSFIQTIAGGFDWDYVACGGTHTIGIKTDGTLWACGNNARGQLGDGTRIDKSSPIQTSLGGTDWKYAVCGYGTTIAIKTDGSLWGWGDDYFGQLGQGVVGDVLLDATINDKLTPIQIFPGIDGWSTAACGYGNVFFLNSNTNNLDNALFGNITPVNYHLNTSDADALYIRKTAQSTNELWACGYNERGQLGTSNVQWQSLPIQIPGNKWQQMACGYQHVAAIKSDNTLWTCGYNFHGQLGNGTTLDHYSFEQMPGTDWAQAACGHTHTAILKTDGTLWTWGYNRYGQLGDETVITRSSPVQIVTGGTDWAQISAGYDFIAAIKTDGSLWTCGYNKDGELGDNAILLRSSPVQTIAGGTDWVQISDGDFHAGAIKTDGSLWMWGYNTYGQLGNNASNIFGISPAQTIAGGTDWSQLSTGFRCSAGIKTDGTLWLWGYNSYGQLGDGTIINKYTPVQTIIGGFDWAYVSCGYQHTMAIKTDGSLWTWGYNLYGQLGDNTIIHTSSPIQTIAGGNDWAFAEAGRFSSVGIKTDGTLWTWGNNSYGQLGDNTIINKSSPAQTIAGGTNWQTIINGYNTMFAIKTDGTLWLWGNGGTGLLGDGTMISQSSPVQITGGGTNWQQISSTQYHVAAIKTDNSLWTWGHNEYGQLMDGYSITTSTPNQVPGLVYSKVSCGNDFTTVIKTDGTLWSAGNNWGGQFGDGVTDHKSSPVQTFAGGLDWVQVSCGDFHAGAIKTDGSLWMWGYNTYGQLGDNSNINKSFPVQTIAGGNDWVHVSCGRNHTAAIKTDGTLWVWGNNWGGQIGNNTVIHVSSPSQTIVGGTDWKYISCGYEHTMAIKTDGSLWAWGLNWSGDLMDNTSIDKSTPVQVMTGFDWVNITCGYNYTMAINALINNDLAALLLNYKNTLV